MNELYWPGYRRLSAKIMPTFADKGYHMVSMMDHYGHILGFLDQTSDASVEK
jgi:CBS-domain-containing membrane protein